MILRKIQMLPLILLMGCSPSPVPDAEMAAWFEKNHEIFIELKSLGEAHPHLHRVEPALADFSHHYAELNAGDKEAERRIINLLDKINSDFVVYWREGGTEKGELFSVSIPYYRWGLALGGYYQGIEYMPDTETLARLTSATRSYKELSLSGWYIHASDTR